MEASVRNRASRWNRIERLSHGGERLPDPGVSCARARREGQEIWLRQAAETPWGGQAGGTASAAVPAPGRGVREPPSGAAGKFAGDSARAGVGARDGRRVENFIRAVEKVDGLEWLAEYELEDIAPGDGFEDEEDPEKRLSGKLFLMMSDGRALAELRSLFEGWRRDPDARFSRGLAPLKHAFEHLREIRPWDVEDRLAETGLLEDWNQRAAFGQETVSFEAEIWYRGSASRRRAAAEQLRQLVEALDGEIVSECVVEDIAYHGMLGRIDIAGVRDLIDRPETRRDVGLFRCDDIMFLRPVGQCAVPIGADSEEGAPAAPTESEEGVAGSPVVALLDGMPLTGHVLLDGRLVVDDPDGYEDAYQAAERSHGTAMASLICHDDLEVGGTAIARPVYVRPIMQPRRWFDGRFVEAVPEDVLPVDLVHRAVVRLFDGEGGEPPSAPEVRVVNLSIGDPARPLDREMSGWARLLDWLSWKYDVLFVVSAGNHLQELSLAAPNSSVRALPAEARQRLVISTVAEDTRHRRLLSPAETLNGVTVGAVHADGSGPGVGQLVDPVGIGLPSVISAHGPGYRRAIKPEIQLPGGRQLVSEDPAPPVGIPVLRPDLSTREPGQRVATPGAAGMLTATHHTRGTSNAAAVGTRGAYFFYELLETLRAQPDGEIPVGFDAVPDEGVAGARLGVGRPARPVPAGARRGAAGAYVPRLRGALPRIRPTRLRARGGGRGTARDGAGIWIVGRWRRRAVRAAAAAGPLRRQPQAAGDRDAGVDVADQQPAAELPGGAPVVRRGGECG